MDEIKSFEKFLIKKRGWISRWPKRAVFLYSGGLDSTITIARLLEERAVELFPLFINRGQTNLIFERRAVRFFENYFLNKYGNIFHDLVEININVPPEEIKNRLKKYVTKFGYPLRNTILQMIGIQYAVSLSCDSKQRISTVFCAQVPDDPFPHSTLSTLRTTTIDVCQSLGEWDWQITSPNIDPFLYDSKTDKKDIVQWAHKQRLPIEKTRSCYSAGNLHCGVCLACKRRKEAFIEANVVDKTKYVN